jgi:tellurium resistance protein TerD
MTDDYVTTGLYDDLDGEGDDDHEDLPPMYDPGERNKIKKGDIINLTELDPAMRKLIIGLGWEVRSFEGERVDMDASCFILNREGLTRENEDFIFYNNLKGCDGAVRHTGDNRTGAGDGDDETIFVDLNGLPFEVEQVVFVVSIYQGYEREQNLGMVRDTFIRITNEETDHEICCFELDVHAMENPTSTAIIVGSIVRDGPKWEFYATADPVDGGLGQIATRYGIIVQE